MEILAIYLAYIWVGLLHAFFIGTCLHAWGRKPLEHKPILAYCLAFFLLAGFETYWIPVFDYISLEVSVGKPSVRAAFGLKACENIVPYLHPRWGNVLFWAAQAGIAMSVARFLKK